MTNSICDFRKHFHLAALAIVFSLFASLAFGQNRTETIAATGQAAPDGNGAFSTFNIPALNGSGEAAFSASLTGTSGGSLDNSGIFRGSGGTITQIARKGQATPDANGTFFGFGDPVFNNSGAVAFVGQLFGTSGGIADNFGIFRGNGGAITQIAREGQAAPDANGTFSSFSSPALNNFGTATFFGVLTGTSGGETTGIFHGSGTAITQIARKGQAAPDGNGTFLSFFYDPSPNDSGTAAFNASLTGTSGGSLDNNGIFRGNGGAITQIARAGQAVPGGNGTFSSFGTPVLNNSGAAAFSGTLTGTSGGSLDNSGIFRGSGGAITQIARLGQTAPDANGTFSGFNSPEINDSGAAAFRAFLTGTSGGFTDNEGVFRGSGGAITQIAREGQAAPDANGTFSSFTSPALNDSGAAAFSATLTGTSGGGSDNGGLYIGDGIDLVQVAREGSLVNGSAITAIVFNNTSGLNNFGQVGYRATLANGDQAIQRFTPDLHWRSTFSSTWDTGARWTLGLNPGQVHDVFIDSAASLTVSGPAANTTVRSLQIGGGTGLATLNLRNGAVLTASNGVTIANKGTLTGDGVINGNLTNNAGGTIVAQNLTVVGGTLNNSGVMRGTGYIDAAVINNSAGQIRANNGDVLQLSGSSLTNSGRIEVIGGEIVVSALLNNQASTGLITGRDATMRFDGGVINAGSIGISVGTSDIFGDINNSSTGIINVSGGATATFYDDVLQAGTMQIVSVGNTSSAAVFFGDLSGGGFVGGGDVFALGDLRPGFSPASVLYDGNLFLGSSTDTFIELGGLGIGEFDQMLVTGELNLAGDLFVSLINGYSLGANQTYLFGDIGGDLLGQFNGLGEGDLVGNFGGRDLFITYGAGNGNDLALFTAVPEPAMAGMLAIFLAGGFLKRRRRN